LCKIGVTYSKEGYAMIVIGLVAVWVAGMILCNLHIKKMLGPEGDTFFGDTSLEKFCLLLTMLWFLFYPVRIYYRVRENLRKRPVS